MSTKPILFIKSMSDLRQLAQLVAQYKRGKLTGNETVFAFKVTDNNCTPPTQDDIGLKYKVGRVFKEPNAVTDRSRQCARGLYAATISYLLSNYGNCGWSLWDSKRMFVVEFRLKDVAAIPTSNDGKFRMSRIKFVREVTKLARAQNYGDHKAASRLRKYASEAV